MLWVLAGIAAFAFIVLFTKPGVLIQGIYHTFFKDLMATPEGADKVFTVKIEQMQNRRVKAVEALQEISGQLNRMRANLKQCDTELANIEKNCEALARGGKFGDELEILAQQREGIVQQKAMYEEQVGELEPMCQDAQEVLTAIEAQIASLEREKVTVVNNLRMNIQKKEMYDTLDNLRKTTVDKLLSDAREGNQRKADLAAGAKVVHESRLTTKVERAEKAAQGVETSDYISQLRAKYNQDASATNKLPNSTQ